MILTIAEAYESNIFVLKTFDNGFSTIECINESLFREIKQKYDPEHLIDTAYKKQL